MPAVKITNHPSIFAWNITEDLPILEDLAILDAFEKEFIFSHQREERQKELLVSRILAQSQFPNVHIHYKDKRPILTNQTHEISISNSLDLVVIMLQETPKKTGIDIQYFSETVLRVQAKFLHPYEFFLPNIQDVKTLNTIWSAKETIYKAYSEDKLEFKKQVIIQNIEENKIEGIVLQKEEEIPFILGCYLSKSYVLTWFI